jgi:purine-binding chemotaxis protein CheW
MAEKIAVEEKQLVVFNLGKESYAVEITLVREIIQLQPITRVPGTPPSVEGVINLRGSIIPIVDLRKRFQLIKIERNKDTRIVVVNCKGQDIGVIVDSVAQVLRIPVDSIEAASNVFSGEHLEHLLGIVKLSNRLVILLDMDRVLSRQEMAAINTMAAINSLEGMKENKGLKAQPSMAGKM